MSLSYTHVQSTPALTWTITHNLSGATMGDVIEDDGGVIRKILPASVKHITDDSMLVEFSEPTKGLVRLVGIFKPTASSGAGAIDPGQYYVATQPFEFFDAFGGTAGALDGRIPSGDTRAWNETFTGSWLLDGSGHLAANSAQLFGSITAQLPLASSYTNGFAVEVVFASPMQSGENVTGLQVFVSGTQDYGFNFLADFPTVGDLMIQVMGGDTNNEYTMAMPVAGVPLTARLEFAGGSHTLFINGTQVMTGDIVNELGSDVKLWIDAGGSDDFTDTMLIDSIAVEELAGSLL